MARHVTLGIFLPVIFLSVKAKAGDSVTIDCDGSAVKPLFNRVHALDLLYRNMSQLTVSEDTAVNVTPIATLKVGDMNGIVSDTLVTMRATLHDFDCASMRDLQCEIFGFVISDGVAKHETIKKSFRPKLLVQGSNPDEVDISVTYMEDSIHVECSTLVGPPEAKWAWDVLLPGQTRFQSLDNISDVTQAKYRNCVPLTTSKVIYPKGGAGDVTLRCRYADRGVASFTMNVKPGEINDETLGTMMMVSTTVLVYTHFILLPIIFSWRSDIFTYRIIREGEDFFMRKMRTASSYILGVVFFIICLALCIACWAHALVSSYLTFTILEFLFIMGYATMRFLSNRDVSNDNKGRLQNARVVTSFGAVICPIICWIVIRINGGICYLALEIFFYLFTGASVICFVCVSFDREGKF